MEGSIENLSRRTVTVRLNTGQTRYIPPRAKLKGIREEEVKNNAMVKKLMDQRLIDLHDVSVGLTSTDMKAENAVAHIEKTPLKKLRHFIPPEEERVTVLRAWERKQEA